MFEHCVLCLCLDVIVLLMKNILRNNFLHTSHLENRTILFIL